MTFDQQYYRINDARLQGKLLVSGQKWQDFVEDRKKLAPIERLDTVNQYGLLQRFNITLTYEVRSFYRVRKLGKRINTRDAYAHFRDLR